MEFVEINENKKNYIELLLLGDEQESMIDRYLEQGKMYVLIDNGVKAQCVVTRESKEVAEIKNIAVKPEFQKMGYGRRMMDFVENMYKNEVEYLLVGTGDGTQNVKFYEKCGYKRSHIVKHFFTDNYDCPIVENGVLLKDMLYLKKCIKNKD